MQIFLFLLPRSWIFLLLLSRTPRFFWNSFHDLEKSCEILRNLPKLIAKISARNLKNSNISWSACQDLGYSWFSCREVQKISWISFHDLETFCEFLRTLPKIFVKILARNVRNPRVFLARKARRQALSKNLKVEILSLQQICRPTSNSVCMRWLQSVKSVRENHFRKHQSAL